MKNQIQTTVPTLHQCITIMSYYEHKSLEDLRFEDYQAKRKFPQQQQSGFGSTLYGSTATTLATGTGSILGSSGMTQSTSSSSGFGLGSGTTGMDNKIIPN